MNQAPLLLMLAAVLLLAGCGSPAARHDVAREIAEKGQFAERQVPADPFLLTVFERVQTGNATTADVYIEGDGLAWLGRHRPSPDPSPTDPVALRLAAADPAAAVAYIARPCQYSRLTTEGACPQKYWTSARFAPEVITALGAALDDLKARHHLTGFNLVGFSGGAAAAALVAARRNDIVSLRSVAGNLDSRLFSQLHNVSPLALSLEPAEAAPKLATVPQHHFVGGEDLVVPADIPRSFIAKAGPSHCLRLTVVPGLAHDGDWPEQWPELLKAPLDCQAP
jgi:pimeloyl-ACP methyl ester carboxylesterase